MLVTTGSGLNEFCVRATNSLVTTMVSCARGLPEILIVLAYFFAEDRLLGFCVDNEFYKKVFRGDIRTLYLFFVVAGAPATVSNT